MNLYLHAISAIIAGIHSYGQDEKPSNYKITGFAEGYLGTASPNAGTGATRVGRQFDPRSRQARLSVAQVNVQYASPDGKFGFTASPWFGDNADILFLGERTDSKLAKHLAQAYVTFSGSNLTVDAGKFYSWIGYESPESIADDNYSRGFLYTLAQPVYHLGVRASTQVNPQWGASLFGTAGWNQVQRSGGGISFGAQIRFTPESKTSASLGLISGKEGDEAPNHAGSFGGIGFGSMGTAQTDLVDLVVTHQATPKLKFALNADYASAHGNGKSGTWSGLAAYAAYRHDDAWAFALRAESVRDHGGLRLGQPATVNSFTLGADYSFNTHFLLRGEFRHDWCNVSIFNSTSGLRNRQTTLNLSLAVRF